MLTAIIDHLKNIMIVWFVCASYVAVVSVRFVYFILLFQVSCHFSSMFIELLVFTWPTLLIPLSGTATEKAQGNLLHLFSLKPTDMYVQIEINL